MGLGRDLYDKMAIGQVHTALPQTDPATAASVAPYAHYERFEAVVRELDALEAAGLIEMQEPHRENSTGRRYVDLVRFKRLK